MCAFSAIGAFAQDHPKGNSTVAVGRNTIHPMCMLRPTPWTPSSKASSLCLEASIETAVTNVLPVPSRAKFQYVSTPYGLLSVFAYGTPVPFPFGQERTGYLVTDIDEAVESAREAGAEVIVEPFQDPVGKDAVVQWPAA